MTRGNLAQRQLPQVHLVPTRHEKRRGELTERCSWAGGAKTTPDPHRVQQSELA